MSPNQFRKSHIIKCMILWRVPNIIKAQYYCRGMLCVVSRLFSIHNKRQCHCGTVNGVHLQQLQRSMDGPPHSRLSPLKTERVELVGCLNNSQCMCADGS